MKKKKFLHLDWETFCELDITKVGAYRYAAHPSCEVLMGSFKIGNGKTLHWDATKKPMPIRLRRALEDPNITIVAFNATFERLILKHVLDMELPIERFHCTMAHAYTLGFVGTLGQVGAALGIDKKKLEEGKDLIKLFCQPRKPTKNKPWTRTTRKHEPEKWERFCAYNVRDTDAEHEIQTYLDKYPMPQHEVELYRLDQKINDRGLPIDRKLCEKALIMAEKERTAIFSKIERVAKIENANSRAQLLGWLHEQGCEIPNLQQSTVDEWLGKVRKNSKVHKVLGWKQMVSKSSISKYEKILVCADDDDRIRGSLQYSGAQRTKRWAGRLIQPQNFIRPPRGYSPEEAIELVMEEEHPEWAFYYLAAALRGAICAPKGQIMSISDLSGIEGRVLPWLCFFQDKLDKIEQGIDMYLVAAAAIYGISYEELDGESPERQTGKVAELALGFQGGWRALNAMAKGYGLEEYSKREGTKIVDAWRRANKPIEQFWDDSEEAAINAVLDPGTPYTAGRVKYIMDGDFLFCILPSGGEIAYYDPAVEESKLSYMGWDSYQKKWTEIPTYGGKLVENATQATAREVIAHDMVLVDQAGFEIVGSVHDEILTCQKPYKKYHHSKLSALMATQPAWAEGLPLGAKGYTEMRYKKD